MQVIGYVNDLSSARDVKLLKGNFNIWPYDWSSTPFHIGTGVDWPGKFRKSPLNPALFPFVDLVADYVGNGVIIYWMEPNELALVPFSVPLARYASIKRFLRPRNWIPEQTEYQPALTIDTRVACGTVLIATGVTIIAITIVEDASLVGVVDDTITIPGGFLLVNYGLRLAVYSPTTYQP